MHHNTNTDNPNQEQPSMLALLRSLMPARKLYFNEALRLAELQANRLLERSNITSTPVPNEIVGSLPRITVEYEPDMPCSGASNWDSRRRTWVITLNALEPDTRHRFSLMHEYKHIVDHGSAGLVELGGWRYFGYRPVEYLAEYFAGCVLIPKRLVKQAWGAGLQREDELADYFDVSPQAIAVRLSQIGLTESRPRCAGPLQRQDTTSRRGRYHRARSVHWPSPHFTREAAA